jgi:hypothetical protein
MPFSAVPLLGRNDPVLVLVHRRSSSGRDGSGSGGSPLIRARSRGWRLRLDSDLEDSIYHTSSVFRERGVQVQQGRHKVLSRKLVGRTVGKTRRNIRWARLIGQCRESLRH